MDELAIVGGIRGQAVEMVKCETVDLEVPATAEIVIEGEIPTDYLEQEGPFGEFTGFMAGGRNSPRVHVKIITHPNKPTPLWRLCPLPPPPERLHHPHLPQGNILQTLAL